MAKRELKEFAKLGYYQGTYGVEEDESRKWLMKSEDAFGNPSGGLFQHKEVLDPKAGENIRIMELLPGEPEDDIRCRLKVVPLQGAPDYEALSYSCGNPKDVFNIFVEDQTMSVTRNLRSALRHLRSDKVTRVLWTDAICIHQKDIDEKAWQIRLMQKIYRTSSKTRIWLGPKTMVSAEAFRECRILYRAAESGSEFPITGLDWSQQDRRFAEGCLRRDSGPSWNSDLMVMLRKSWFDRVWCAQEAILSPSAQVHCGLDSIAWSSFKQAIHYGFNRELMVSRTEQTFYFNRTNNSYTFIPTRRDDIRDNPAENLLAYLMDYRHRHATVDSDKVFSLLGLVDRVESIGIQPDYRLTTEQVYQNATMQILKNANNLDILGAAGPSPTLKDCPSWVADWTALAQDCQALGYAGRKGTAATMGSLSDITFDKTLQLLIVPGQHYGTVQAVSVALPSMAPDELSKLDQIDDEFSDKTSTDWTGWRDAAHFASEAAKMTKASTSSLSILPKVISAVLQWEKFAGVETTKTPRAKYWQTLCAEHYLDNDPELTEREFLSWFKALSSQRKMSKISFLSKSMAATTLVHLGSNWSEESRFPQVLQFAYGRRLAKVDDHLALVPAAAQVGDDVLLCKGARVPLIARRHGDDWKFLGEGYVNSIMQGEAFREDQCKEIRFK